MINFFRSAWHWITGGLEAAMGYIHDWFDWTIARIEDMGNWAGGWIQWLGAQAENLWGEVGRIWRDGVGFVITYAYNLWQDATSLARALWADATALAHTIERNLINLAYGVLAVAEGLAERLWTDATNLARSLWADAVNLAHTIERNLIALAYGILAVAEGFARALWDVIYREIIQPLVHTFDAFIAKWVPILERWGDKLVAFLSDPLGFVARLLVGIVSHGAQFFLGLIIEALMREGDVVESFLSNWLSL